MADLTVVKAREMVRLRILEKNKAFWENDQVDRAIDEGCYKLQNIAIGGAHLSRRMRRHTHPYLRKYIAKATGTLTPGNYEADLPSDIIYEIQFNILSSPPLEAKWKEPNEDRFIRVYPGEFGPGPDESFFTVLPFDDGVAKIRVYIGDDGWLANRTLPYQFFYLRRYSPCWNQSPPVDTLDLDEEFAEGPIAYASGKLLSDQRTNPQPLYDELVEFAKRIGLPPIDPQAPAILPKKVP